MKKRIREAAQLCINQLHAIQQAEIALFQSRQNQKEAIQALLELAEQDSASGQPEFIDSMFFQVNGYTFEIADDWHSFDQNNVLEAVQIRPSAPCLGCQKKSC